MKTCRGVEVQNHVFLTSALVGYVLFNNIRKANAGKSSLYLTKLQIRGRKHAKVNTKKNKF
jgi:hypothetical protein